MVENILFFIIIIRSVFFVLGAKDCVSFYECFRMICAFDHGSLVKDVINKMRSNNIDEK